MFWIRYGIVAACLAAVLLVAGPLGTRVGLWTFLVGFLMLGISVLLGLVSIVFLSVGWIKTSQWGMAMIGIIIALVVLAVPTRVILGARSAPPIHDITTDFGEPPQFVAILPLRASAPNPPEYAGASAAEQQRRAFPDIQPLVIPFGPAEAYRRVVALVRDRGWEVVATDEAGGRVEATDTTFWFRFKDDIVIRIRPEGSGSRIDVRSKSRVGVGDLGTNARRVRELLMAIRDS